MTVVLAAHHYCNDDTTIASMCDEADKTTFLQNNQ